MARVPATIPVTDLRQDAASALKCARFPSACPDHHRGCATAVLLGIEGYDAGEHELHLLRRLAKGDRRARARGHDLDAVPADADELLARN